MQEKIIINSDDTSGSLHDKLAILGGEMLIRFLDNPKSYPVVLQNEAGVSYAHKINKPEAAINWSLPAEEVTRNIRGYNPFPGAYTFLNGILHKIWQAEIVPDYTTIVKAGTIITECNDGLLVACGDGKAISIMEIQEAGAKRKDIGQYLQGKSNLTNQQFKEE